jgi:UDP-N-acetyl-D-mannosaminuronate dehydrogenase
MADLVVGYGEIGHAVQEVVCPEAKTVDTNKRNYKVGAVNVMHICFPYTEKFIETVWDYVARFQPQRIVIWSTVPIGTTRKISSKAIHTPVESKHPKLASGIKLMPRWIGYNDDNSAKFFEDYFKKAKLKVKLVKDTRITEALKLLSTTEYGINIVFADYKKRVFDDIGADFELTKEWNRNYNQLYRELGLHNRFQKFVLDAPEGKIGGHCVMPNYKLLNEQYPDDLLKMLRRFE